ncbi:hypothetical protein JAAARDRAFT_68141 [Jaapia argillacea MUCL 33604]|uniref:DUF6593 domain-containing protein n=1 Tax=Jaapia argillacea MUCL 33604 TaxID=933084 RepID=A0A067Q7P1_9AGAM|nr:hypothetical protein JAAARDRAFT_68141 [Jaapia argillacea MUCL 33604]
MDSPYFNLFFTGRDDPRDGCIMIGEDTKPIYYQFDTYRDYAGHTRTTVFHGNRTILATLEWNIDGSPGVASIGGRQIHLSRLVMAGSTRDARMFFLPDGRRYEWRRCSNEPGSYELFAGPGTRIANYRRCPQPTPVGPSHGYIQYTFDDDVLLLYSLLALSLNRCMDSQAV